VTSTRLPMHARNHRPKGWYGPDDPGGSDPLNWWGSGGDAARPAYSGVVLAIDSLRGYWRLGDGPAPYADTSGYDTDDPANLAIPGSVGTTPTDDLAVGVLPALHDDGAVRFNGDSRLHAPVTVARFEFTGGSQFTATGWVRPAAGSAAGTVYLQNAGADVLNGWRVGFATGRAVQFARHQRSSAGTSQNTQILQTSFGIPEMQWAFIAAVVDATHMRLYVDGAQVEADTVDFNHGGSGNAPLSIGYNANGSGGIGTGDHLDGDLDELAIFHAALSAGQIQELYAAGRPETLVPTVFGPYTIPATVAIVGADGTFTVTLPPAADRAGSTHTIKNVGTGTITVSGAGTDPIDGTGTPGTVVLGALDAVTLTSVGHGWWITGGYGI
jgi:hypothetical protein